MPLSDVAAKELSVRYFGRESPIDDAAVIVVRKRNRRRRFIMRIAQKRPKVNPIGPVESPSVLNETLVFIDFTLNFPGG